MRSPKNVFVFPDVKAFSVRFTGIVEWEQICDRACWQDALILCAKHIESDRADGAEACLLAKLQPVHVQFRAHELDLHIRLQNLQLLHIQQSCTGGLRASAKSLSLVGFCQLMYC